MCFELSQALIKWQRKLRRIASVLCRKNGGKASPFSEEGGEMLNVPSGHLPVYVGIIQQKRFVVRATDLNHPLFRELLDRAEEEFGFESPGLLTIPCEEFHFLNILGVVRNKEADQKPLNLNVMCVCSLDCGYAES
ncbi:hypothetical protein SUGI_1141610 [Cryptomeria japonica]|nr:hypothetical protein SUGI_1141610 [Cryptomeria japonica]